jgi:hypothetical protein
MQTTGGRYKNVDAQIATDAGGGGSKLCLTNNDSASSMPAGWDNVASSIRVRDVGHLLLATRPNTDDRIERGGVPAPVIGKDGSVRSAQDVPQHEGGDDGVIQRPCHGDELGDQVDRRDAPHQGEPQPPLAAARDPGIGEKPSEQDDEVREQGRQLASLRPPAEQQEDEDRQHPQRQRTAARDQEGAKHERKRTTPIRASRWFVRTTDFPTRPVRCFRVGPPACVEGGTRNARRDEAVRWASCRYFFTSGKERSKENDRKYPTETAIGSHYPVRADRSPLPARGIFGKERAGVSLRETTHRVKPLVLPIPMPRQRKPRGERRDHGPDQHPDRR